MGRARATIAFRAFSISKGHKKLAPPDKLRVTPHLRLVLVVVLILVLDRVSTPSPIFHLPCSICSLHPVNWATQCAAVIPCLNEELAIAEVIAGVKRHLPTVLVVDDGSSDQTAVRAEAAGAKVLRNTHNLGKGASLRIGWNHAQQLGLNWSLSLDGDGQHAAEDMPQFFECAERTSACLVIGNRMHDPASMPWLRRLVNRWMSRRLSNLAGVALPDSQCGFRLMNLDVWSRLPLHTNHFEIESEVLLSFARAGQLVEFVPIRTLYKSEHSKISPLKDTIRWFKWWRRA